MKKAKYFIILALSLVLSAFIYLYGLKVHFFPIMPIYMVIALFGICGYMFLHFRNNNEIGKALSEGKQPCQEQIKRRKEQMKLFVAVFLPFVIVVLADCIYILLLEVNPHFNNFLKLFG